MSLTDDWKAGKLELRHYYIELQNGDIEIEHYIGGFLSNINNPVIKVLAPVPDYEELGIPKDGEQISLFPELSQKSNKISIEKKVYDSILNNSMKLNAEVEKLRDLLKECKNIVAHDLWSRAQFPDGQVVEKDDILTRINAAIGESEE